MDFWFLFWSAYPGVALAVAVFAGRTLPRITGLGPGDSAGVGLLLGLVWPFGLPWVIVTGFNQREAQAAKRRRNQEMDLETAHRVIARHELAQEQERKERRARMHRDWEKAAREALLPSDGPVWRRNIDDFNN